MDHEATREQLELAAAEPGGLERLMAGDTLEAQAVAAHLAGCPACTGELARLERAARVIGQVVREQPPVDLRERTLATIRTAGVRRGAAAEESLVAPFPRPTTAGRGVSISTRGRSALGWVAAIAAAVVVSVIATSFIVGGRVDERLAAYANEIEALERVTIATLEVTAEPDVRRVALGGAEPAVAGSLVFSPSTSELVVVATGLTPPPEGQEYRCWVEQAGGREGVGKMFFSDDLAYWIGPVPPVQGLVGDATFGVTLVDVSGAGGDSRDVLVGGF
jgi:anti-sigma factor RsiW